MAFGTCFENEFINCYNLFHRVSSIKEHTPKIEICLRFLPQWTFTTTVNGGAINWNARIFMIMTEMSAMKHRIYCLDSGQTDKINAMRCVSHLASLIMGNINLMGNWRYLTVKLTPICQLSLNLTCRFHSSESTNAKFSIHECLCENWRLTATIYIH